ncbi:hypothetical protein DL762_002850 [Monosporascus cannonballus]|uniref:Uncharacterized protein n=1 Tax=Monosporascus cannonballus TaxID=155416 RepID=A0ABY0HC97_9PEZI|nr:hypothetical protein DL762_002850 [Monosporascus cannonballus]RYO95587.1 hypothetical protein DL763_003657 [Monosporascus cannonballus]
MNDSYCTNVDTCDHERTSRRGVAACPNLEVRRYLGYGQSLCVKHDQEAREERKEEADLLGNIARLDAEIEKAGSFTVWLRRNERTLLTERLATLRRKALLDRYRNVMNQLNEHPPVHVRLRQVRRELERERQPTWAGRHPRALRPRAEEAELEREREREESQRRIIEERYDHRKGVERARRARREAQLRQAEQREAKEREEERREWARVDAPRTAELLLGYGAEDTVYTFGMIH